MPRRVPGDDAAQDPATTHAPGPVYAQAPEPQIGAGRPPAPGQPPEPVPNPRNPAELWHPGVGWSATAVDEERVDPTEILDAGDRRDPSRRRPEAPDPRPRTPGDGNETVIRGQEAVDAPVSKTWHALPVSAEDGNDVVDPFHPDYALQRSAELDRQPPSSDDRGGPESGPTRGSSLISGPIGRTRRSEPAKRRGQSLFGPATEDEDPASAPPRTAPPRDPDT